MEENKNGRIPGNETVNGSDNNINGRDVSPAIYNGMTKKQKRSKRKSVIITVVTAVLTVAVIVGAANIVNRIMESRASVQNQPSVEAGGSEDDPDRAGYSRRRRL